MNTNNLGDSTRKGNDLNGDIWSVEETSVHFMKICVSDIEFVTPSRLLLDELISVETYAKEFFEFKGWNVIRPVWDFDDFKFNIGCMVNEFPELRHIHNNIKNEKSSKIRQKENPNRWELIKQLLGIPDFFMIKTWKDEDDVSYPNKEYRFCEIKNKHDVIHYSQINWAITYKIPIVYYVYFVEKK